MAVKLGEAGWTGFKKTLKADCDDKALLAAPKRLDRTDASDPEPRLVPLDDVVAQLKKQVAASPKRKKVLGDKAFGKRKDKLHELLDSAEKLHKSATQAAADAKAADDDDETPAALTTKMVPLMRQLKKGDVRHPVLIGSISKTAAVLISRQSTTNARRKLLNEALSGSTR